MKSNFYYQNHKGVYYIRHSHHYISYLVHKIGLRMEEYYDIMVNNYHGELNLPRSDDNREILWTRNDVYFKIEEDVKNAIDWLTSRLLIEELKNEI